MRNASLCTHSRQHAACEQLESRVMLDALPWNDALPGPMPAGQRGAVAADFDLDGKIDIALPVGRELRFLKGNGDGTFAAPVALTLGTSIGPIAIGRMDGNNRPDLVDAAALAGGKLLTRLICFDPALGRFKVTARLVTQGAFSARANPAYVGLAVQTGNFIGGWRDEILAQVQGSTVRVIRVLNRTTLAEAGTISTQFDLNNAKLADLNSDGLEEIYFSDGTSIRGVVRSNYGNSFTEVAPLYRTAGISSFVIADMTGDGKLDFILLQNNGFTNQRRPLALLEGDGNGRIAQMRDWASTTNAPLNIQLIHAAQDVNNDGRLDIVGQTYFVNQDRGGSYGSTSLVVLLDDGAGGWTEQSFASESFSTPPNFSIRPSLAALSGSGPDLLDLLSYSGMYPMSTLTIRPSAIGPVAPRLSGGKFRLNSSYAPSATGFYADVTTTTAHADLGGNLRRVEIIWDRNDNGMIDVDEEVIGSADSSHASQNVMRVAALLPDDVRDVPVFHILARGVGIDGQFSNVLDLGSITWSS